MQQSVGPNRQNVLEFKPSDASGGACSTSVFTNWIKLKGGGDRIGARPADCGGHNVITRKTALQVR